MKNKILKIITAMSLATVMFGVNAKAYGETYANNAIKIDGYYDDWTDKPYTEIRWDWDKVHLAHRASLFRDDKNVYLYIKMSPDNYTKYNGYNYNFYIDGNTSSPISFAAVYDGGNTDSLGPGNYKLTVRSQNGYYPVGEGYLTRQSNESDAAELVIPLSAFGNNVNPDTVKTIQFYTPNLGPQYVTCTGTSTAPYITIGLGCLLAVGGYLNLHKKKKESR